MRRPAVPEALAGLYRLQRQDIGRAAAVLADAFREDPVWSRAFEQETGSSRWLAAFEVPVRYCFRYGDVYATTPNLEGVAAWLPGERADMTPGRMILSGAIICGLRMGAAAGRRLEPVFRPLQADRKRNMRGMTYTYLQVIGVAPQARGRGWGGKLLRALIRQSEQLGRDIYLETETEPNVRMYERFGFRTLKATSLPVVNLPMWEMVRASGNSRT